MSMMRTIMIAGWIVAPWTCSIVAAADAKPNQEFAKKATWQIPTAVSAHEQAIAWLAAQSIDPAARVPAEMLWASAIESPAEGHLLDILAATLAAGDPQARELVSVCSQSRQQIALPNVEWLSGDKIAPLERNNLRLLFGRWLVQESLYDEALEQLGQLKPEEVVDPSALLFYQAIIYHRTLNREAGLQTIGRLLEHESEIARRYTSVVRLMQADLDGLKDESLDHIARRMDDVRRRLDLGRAGPKVREVEDGVIASLDKLIDEIEKQQQAAAAAAAARSGNLQPRTPAQDSTPMGGKGRGEVAKKPIGDQSGWGQLPPHERQEALQQIGKDFPAHYRDVIEQYFRKLATESDEKSEK